jgi:hypothetical protein
MSQDIESIFLAAFFFPAVAAALIFTMKYLSAVLQARVRQDQDESYRQLAAQAAAAQAGAAAALSSFGTALAEIRSRPTAVEKLLTDVE